MKYAHSVTKTSIFLVELSTGETIQFFAGDALFDVALERFREGDLEGIFALSAKTVIKNMNFAGSSITVDVSDGVGTVTLHEFNDMVVPLHRAIVDKLLLMTEQGFSCDPMVKFINRLYNNPSNTSINELYMFIEAAGLPITDDGYFIAYKIVRNDYMDIYSGTISNAIGEVCSMPRNMVDDQRNRTCSNGLHFCSKSYLSSYGTSSRAMDRCMLVKIDPAKVVSIPSDYNNAKGRCEEYTVVGELPAGWRAEVGMRDYTSSAVVDSDGWDYSDRSDDRGDSHEYDESDDWDN